MQLGGSIDMIIFNWNEAISNDGGTITGYEIRFRTSTDSNAEKVIVQRSMPATVPLELFKINSTDRTTPHYFVSILETFFYTVGCRHSYCHFLFMFELAG